MTLKYETPALDLAIGKLTADITDPEQERKLLADAANVITGLERGAGCADRFKNLAVNCGGVCTNEVRLCQVIETDQQPSMMVPDVAGGDIPIGDRRQTIGLQPMRVD